jgi:hypothetical protein
MRTRDFKVRVQRSRLVVCSAPGFFYVSVRPRRRWYAVALIPFFPGLYAGRSEEVNP